MEVQDWSAECWSVQWRDLVGGRMAR